VYFEGREVIREVREVAMVQFEVFGSGSAGTGLSAVSGRVRVVAVVILGSKAAEGACFSSQIVIGFGTRCERRCDMLKVVYVS
jgi:hypothetical protein